ncbi:hypothetical protein RFI_35086, partial [Reticulomyxa filosa]
DVLKNYNKMQQNEMINVKYVKDKGYLNEMMIFSENIGLHIKYDEDNNSFHFYKIRVCTSLRILSSYAYACIGDFILFFGGYGGIMIGNVTTVHKYSMTENKWMRYKQYLPISLRFPTVVLTNDNTSLHIFGVFAEKAKHFETKVNEWMKKEQKWMAESKDEVEEISIELEEMKPVRY